MSAKNTPETVAQLKLKAAGTRLIHLMDERGVSSTELANALGVSNGAVSQWRKGVSKMSQTNLEKAAEYLQTSPSYLSSGYVDDGGAGMFPLSESEAAIVRTLRELVPDNEYSTDEKALVGAVRKSQRLDANGVVEIIGMLENLSVADFAKVINAIQQMSKPITASNDVEVEHLYLMNDGQIQSF